MPSRTRVEAIGLMAWVRLDDQFFRNPKVIRAGRDARELYVAALCFCAAGLTDGEVPADALPMLAADAGVKKPASAVDRLLAVGLWTRVAAGFAVHDYLDYNPAREHVLNERSMSQVRKDLYADPGLVHRVRNRDGDLCRYCGREVRWTDRKSAGGGTYDHIVPNGGNSDDNIVVACRGCNSAKGQRTPEQWGVSLLAPGSRMESLRSGTRSGTRSEPDRIHRKSAYPSPSPSRPSPVRNDDEEKSSTTTTVSRAVHGEPTPLPVRPRPAAVAPPGTYAATLGPAPMGRLEAIALAISPQFTAGWLGSALARIEADVGPLPRERLGPGLDLAFEQIRRDAGNGRVRAPRPFAESLIATYLREQAVEHAASAAVGGPDPAVAGAGARAP